MNKFYYLLKIGMFFADKVDGELYMATNIK